MRHTEQPNGDHADLLPGTASAGSLSAARVRAGLVALLALCVTGYNHLRYRSAISAAAQQDIETRTQRAVAEIDGIARKAMGEVDTITRGLSAGTIAPHDVARHFERALAANRDISGLVVAYRPHGYDPARRLHATLLARDGERLKTQQVEQLYDYTQPVHTWYAAAMAGSAGWAKPFFGEASGTRIVTYSAPFHRPGESNAGPLGVVALVLSLDRIRSLVESLDLGPGGFGALVSAEGIYLYHPNPDLVVESATLPGLARQQNDPDRLRLAEATARRESGILDHRSISTGLQSWLVYAPVPATGWSLHNTFLKEDIPYDPLRLRHELMQLLALGVLALCAAGALLLRADTGRTRPLWALSGFVAVVFTIAIGCIWALFLNLEADRTDSGLRVTERAALEKAMAEYRRESIAHHTEAPVYIPTGIYLESAQFVSASDLQITGFVWQKYRLGEHDGLARGFALGNAIQLEANENYRERREGIELVRWQFRATVRQQFDRSRYPLEVVRAAIRIFHKELNHNVVLVPDLPAYRLLNPSSLPGWAEGLQLPGWKVDASYFEFRKLHYDTDFGAGHSYAKGHLPSLYYTILLRRNVLDSALSHLTPLAIVAVVLFILTMLTSRDEKLVGFLQTGSGRVLNICTAIFFVIAFSHIEIRRRLATETLFYMEYFYFLIYFILLWVALNSVIFAKGVPIAVIQYRDNLLPRLFYWPFMMGVLLAITFWTFY